MSKLFINLLPIIYRIFKLDPANKSRDDGLSLSRDNNSLVLQVDSSVIPQVVVPELGPVVPRLNRGIQHDPRINFYALKPSKICSIILLTFFLLALLVITSTNLFWEVKIFLTLLCFSYFFSTLCQQVLLTNPTSIRKLWPTANNAWALENNNGAIIAGELCGDSIKTKNLVILNFKIPVTNRIKKNKIASVVIFYDSLDKETFRHLRIRLFK